MAWEPGRRSNFRPHIYVPPHAWLNYRRLWRITTLSSTVHVNISVSRDLYLRKDFHCHSTPKEVAENRKVNPLHAMYPGFNKTYILIFRLCMFSKKPINIISQRILLYQSFEDVVYKQWLATVRLAEGADYMLQCFFSAVPFSINIAEKVALLVVYKHLDHTWYLYPYLNKACKSQRVNTVETAQSR